MVGTPPLTGCDVTKPLGAYDMASSICRAAIHAGVLTDIGGEFNVTVVAKLTGTRCASRSNGMHVLYLWDGFVEPNLEVIFILDSF